LTEVHLSEVNSTSKHEPVSHAAILAYRQVASLIPTSVPVILESIVTAELIDDEIDAAHESLAIDGPRPRIRPRRSGATPNPIHTLAHVAVVRHQRYLAHHHDVGGALDCALVRSTLAY
jgi:hypothetical protein